MKKTTNNKKTFKLRVNDKVIVIAGKDKGKKGEILAIDKKNDKVVVKGVNIITKHIKKRADKPGERIQYEGKIHISNVALESPVTNKPTRIGFEIEDGKKYRICKSSKQRIDK